MTIRTLTTNYSMYEIDEENKLIRRTLSLHGPTPRQGKDGEWKPYFDLVETDYGLLVLWDDEGHGTLTSPIKSQ